MLRIAVTGHRPNKLWGYDIYSQNYVTLGKHLRNYILELSTGYDSIELISGMALGVDTIFALVALKLRESDKRFSLHCAIPCKNHSSNWLKESVQLYNSILDRADSVKLVSEKSYTPSCMQARNEYMVQRANLIIAVWDGTSGGTGNCVKYSERIGKPVFRINPREI